uniref:MADF domain-containing protein n=1 Tax=Timema genevievae TaxID=629358 RepID=A0A7R9JVI5_TIMGE|nr:unnamed protein product [Timema genevievae]
MVDEHNPLVAVVILSVLIFVLLRFVIGEDAMTTSVHEAEWFEDPWLNVNTQQERINPRVGWLTRDCRVFTRGSLHAQFSSDPVANGGAVCVCVLSSCLIIEQILEIVYTYPVLYDSSHKDYKNIKKYRIWKEIGKELKVAQSGYNDLDLLENEPTLLSPLLAAGIFQQRSRLRMSHSIYISKIDTICGSGHEYIKFTVVAALGNPAQAGSTGYLLLSHSTPIKPKKSRIPYFQSVDGFEGHQDGGPLTASGGKESEDWTGAVTIGSPYYSATSGDKETNLFLDGLSLSSPVAGVEDVPSSATSAGRVVSTAPPSSEAAAAASSSVSCCSRLSESPAPASANRDSAGAWMMTTPSMWIR